MPLCVDFFGDSRVSSSSRKNRDGVGLYQTSFYIVCLGSQQALRLDVTKEKRWKKFL